TEIAEEQGVEPAVGEQPGEKCLDVGIAAHKVFAFRARIAKVALEDLRDDVRSDGAASAPFRKGEQSLDRLSVALAERRGQTFVHSPTGCAAFSPDVGGDGAGLHEDDLNVIGKKFEAKSVGPAAHSEFRGGVGGHERDGCTSADRTDINHAAARVAEEGN